MSIFLASNTEEYSVIDPIKPTLDNHIVKNGKINESVRDTILSAVEKVANSLNVKVDRIWLIGSSLTYQWTPESDLDVTLFVSKSKDECKELNKLSAKHFNEKIFIKKHPVNFYFDPGRFLKFKSDAIYDLEHDKWIKKPESISEEDVQEIIQGCSTVKEFNEILKEYTDLKQLMESYSGAENELEDILYQTLHVSSLFNKIKDKRREDYKKRGDPDLPSANYRCSNIIYKLLEHYGLGDLVVEVTHFLESRFKN